VQVVDAGSGQTYSFNRYGQHVTTADLVTGRVLYNFTYSVNSYYGRLMKASLQHGLLLKFSQDLTYQTLLKLVNIDEVIKK